MELIRHRKLGHLQPFQLLKDDPFLYFITTSQKTGVSCYDLKNEIVFSKFVLDHLPYAGCSVDESCLYFPTQVGQVLSLDKYSGDVLQVIDVGWASILSEVIHDDKNIYTVCGVPLSNGIKISTNQYCLVINDKITGNKKGQSKFFRLEPFRYFLDSDALFLSSGNILYKFQKTCEITDELILTYIPSDNFLSYGDLLILFSEKGSITFLNKDNLSVVSGLAVESNKSTPIIVNDSLYWFCMNKLHKINLDTYLKEEIMDIGVPIVGKVTCSNDVLVGKDQDGSLIEFNVNDNKLYKIFLDKEISNPVVIDKSIFAYSPTSFYQVEI